MKKIISFIASILLSILNYAQECGNCKEAPSVANYDLEVRVPKPDVNNLKDNQWLEWLQLFWLNKYAHGALFQNKKACIRFTQPSDASMSNESFTTQDGIEVPPLNEESQQIKVGETYTNLPPSGDVSRFANYLITGYVAKSGNGYMMHMEVQTACSRKTVASTDVPFQLSSILQNSIAIGQQAAAQLSPLIDKIKAFELKERTENKKAALDGGIEDAIIIKPKKRALVAGEQTEIEITLKDCDGAPLANREVFFTKATLNGTPISAGTTGGTVNPSMVITDASGKAKASFKMGSQKSAIINAHHIYDKPYGCEYVKLGSTPIGGNPIKVEVNYMQNETDTLKRATLPGVEIKGGMETEHTIMFHNSVLYHYPAASAIKKGYLVLAENENPEADAKTEYILESGYYDYIKKVKEAQITGMAGNIEMVKGIEKGEEKKIEAYASLQNHSQIFFFKGDAGNPPQFSWSIQYPAKTDGELGYGAIILVKGEEGVEWNVKKITDPNSLYKTEYRLSLKLNAAKELKKGDKAMKDLFGFKLDDLTTAIDPTKPQANMVRAGGSQTITVRILSPYPAEKYD